MDARVPEAVMAWVMSHNIHPGWLAALPVLGTCAEPWHLLQVFSNLMRAVVPDTESAGLSDPVELEDLCMLWQSLELAAAPDPLLRIVNADTNEFYVEEGRFTDTTLPISWNPKLISKAS